MRRVLLVLLVALLVPLGASAVRKFRTAGKSGLLLTSEPSGWRVVSEGVSSGRTGLRPGDLLLMVDGREARELRDPVGILEEMPRDVTLLRDGALVRVRTDTAPVPLDARYVVLLAVGAAFLAAAGAALRGSTLEPEPGPFLLFAGFSLCAATVLVVTPVPPFDRLYRASVLLEDAARAFLPAFLLAFVLRFPRRARRAPLAPLFVAAAGLAAASFATYLIPPPPGVDATARIVRLDGVQEIWLAAGILAAGARVVLLARRRTDLVAEKQCRFLLAGTVGGLFPVALLDLVPRFFGGHVPVLSTLSILPLLLVPVAFTAALTRYRLWDVEILARETGALLGAGFLAAAIFAGAQLLDLGALAPGVPYGRGLVETAAGLVLALTFLPVRRGLSGALARWQYGDGWAERESLLALVRELSEPRRLAEVGPLLVDRVSRGLAVPRAALLLSTGDGAVDGQAVDGGGPIALDELPAGAGRGPVRLSRLAFASEPTAGVARLRQAGFRTLAPLALSGRLLGLLAIADRHGREPLSVEDLALLQTVLASAALAIDHARLYEQLEERATEYRRLKEFHEDVVAGSAAAIAATDDGGVLTTVNPAFEKLFGNGTPLVGRRVEEVLPAAVRSASPAGRVETEVGEARRVLDVAVSPFPGAPEGSPARVFVVSDATELTRLERTVAERDRLEALSHLSAGMAHEVNTPLTGVASFARLLLDETPADDPRRPMVEKIEQQAFRAARLVGSLLDLARGRPRQMTPLDPAELVREACRALSDEIDGRGVALELRIPPGLPVIRGHGDALVQVLVNLLKNAVEAVSAPGSGRAGPGHVRVAAVQAADTVDLSVEDDGPGLSAEEAEKVFRPFTSTKTSQGGVGLGLAIARDIIRAHGGTLSVDSAPGGGARFTVRLPVGA